VLSCAATRVSVLASTSTRLTLWLVNHVKEAVQNCLLLHKGTPHALLRPATYLAQTDVKLARAPLLPPASYFCSFCVRLPWKVLA